MLSIPLGPVALPLAPLILLAAVWAAAGLASRVARREAPADDASAPPRPALTRPPAGGSRALGDAAGHVVFMAALIGLGAARLAHLALHAPAYLAEPWFVLDLRDGGWHLPSGWAAAAAFVLWRARRAPPLRRALAAGATLGLVLGLTPVLLQQMHRAAERPMLPLDRLEGGAPVTLAQVAAGRPAVVNLWATWCAPCRSEMPTLAAAQRREPDVAFIFVNQGEAAGTVRAWLQREGLPLQEVLLDPHAALGAALGSRGLPTTLFYDAAGRAVDAHFGVLNAQIGRAHV